MDVKDVGLLTVGSGQMSLGRPTIRHKLIFRERHRVQNVPVSRNRTGPDQGMLRKACFERNVPRHI